MKEQHLWKILPISVRRKLLIGSEGRLNLVDVAQLLLQSTQGAAQELSLQYVRLAASILFVAWSKDPLNGQMAGQLLALNEKVSTLDQAQVQLLQKIHACYKIPSDLRYFRRLAEKRTPEKLISFLDAQFKKDRENLYWYNQAVCLGFFEEDWDYLHKILSLPFLNDFGDCVQRIKADVLWLQGDKDKACEMYAGLAGPDPCFRRAVRLWEKGQKPESKVLMAELLSAYPWLNNELLVIHDLLTETGIVGKDLPGKTAILIYSFNKADELGQTLESLAASSLGKAKVWVLNNGSSDNTLDVARKWQAEFPVPLEVIDLPVNVGAPAARNWLMHLPEVGRCEWVVYLDDDVVLPKNWLESLGAAASVYPDAGVWGCRVVDANAKSVVQSADLHIVPGAAVEPGSSEYEKRFAVSHLHHQTLDFVHIGIGTSKFSSARISGLACPLHVPDR